MGEWSKAVKSAVMSAACEGPSRLRFLVEFSSFVISFFLNFNLGNNAIIKHN